MLVFSEPYAPHVSCDVDKRGLEGPCFLGGGQVHSPMLLCCSACTSRCAVKVAAGGGRHAARGLHACLLGAWPKGVAAG